MDKALAAFALLLGLIVSFLWHDGFFCSMNELCQKQWNARIDHTIASSTGAGFVAPAAPIANSTLATSTTPTAVTDAIRIPNNGKCKLGELQYSWRGRTDWCLHSPRKQPAQLSCQDGVLGWVYPRRAE